MFFSQRFGINPALNNFNDKIHWGLQLIDKTRMNYLIFFLQQ